MIISVDMAPHAVRSRQAMLFLLPYCISNSKLKYHCISTGCVGYIDQALVIQIEETFERFEGDLQVDFGGNVSR